MSLADFQVAVRRARLRDKDAEWFPRWIEQYRTFQGKSAKERLEVDRESVVAFLADLKKRGRPAWTRLQAARAIDSYRTLVLESDEADLSDILQRLGDVAAEEGRQGPGAGRRAAASDSATIPGPIDPSEPAIIQTLRRELRTRHYSIRTESAYVGWVHRFLKAHGTDHADALGEGDVKEFLSSLAVDRNVAASTQNQAFSALVFLFRNVLKRELEFLDAARAKKPQRLPVVLARGEVQRLMMELGGRDLLMAQLLYGAGLRQMECLRLRVKDIEFETGGRLRHPYGSRVVGTCGREHDHDLHARDEPARAGSEESAGSPGNGVSEPHHQPVTDRVRRSVGRGATVAVSVQRAAKTGGSQVAGAADNALTCLFRQSCIG